MPRTLICLRRSLSDIGLEDMAEVGTARKQEKREGQKRKDGNARKRNARMEMQVLLKRCEQRDASERKIRVESLKLIKQHLFKNK
jgi:hypothetical protein